MSDENPLTYVNTTKQYPSGGVGRVYSRKWRQGSILPQKDIKSIFSKTSIENECFKENGVFFIYITIESVR